MNTVNATELNRFLQSQPSGVVLLSEWLEQQGVGEDLQKQALEKGWIKSIGPGAMVRTGDPADSFGAVHTLQRQTGSTVHPGGLTALGLLGSAHYIELFPTRIVVFGSEEEALPDWVEKNEWDLRIRHFRTSFLPPDLGLVDYEYQGFTIRISDCPRAVMECLYHTPEMQLIVDVYEVMEGLFTLTPEEVQPLLEQCRSVKVKRLFLYLAEKAEHEWVSLLEMDRIDLGQGDLTVEKDGVYVPRYRITVPFELEDDYYSRCTC